MIMEDLRHAGAPSSGSADFIRGAAANAIAVVEEIGAIRRLSDGVLAEAAGHRRVHVQERSQRGGGYG